MVIRKKRKCNISTRLIIDTVSRLSVEKPLQFSLSEIRKRLQLAYKKYKQVKIDAKKHRRNMQDRLAEEKAKAGNEDVAKVIRRMKVEEDTRHTHTEK